MLSEEAFLDAFLFHQHNVYSTSIPSTASDVQCNSQGDKGTPSKRPLGLAFRVVFTCHKRAFEEILAMDFHCVAIV